MKVINNNDLSFLKDKECHLLFYCTASWCGPCKKISPLIEKISDGSDPEKLEIYKIDIDENDEVSHKLNIKSVPTFLLFKNRELKEQCSGADIKKVQDILKNIE
tara:strand:- start:250 stop:561 length:312 start_codon:yes stop_codon:yes gene_type:complete